MKVTTYQAYQINIISELEFPELPPSEHDTTLPDVFVRLGDVAPNLADSCVRMPFFQVSAHEVLLNMEGFARYLVSDGKQILVDPEPGAAPDHVRLFLLGSAMGVLHYQRGLLPLHGSAIETPLGAMVFAGPQGIGKSTLAAHFQRRGYRILSDDVCVIARDSLGQLQALPSFPKLRLCADAMERLTKSGYERGGERFDGDKFIVPLDSDHCRSPVKLAAIHLLSHAPETRFAITPLRGFDKIRQLLANLYRPEYLHGLEREGDVMRLAFETVSQIPLLEITHDRNPERIEELIDRLEQEWRQNGMFQQFSQVCLC